MVGAVEDGGGAAPEQFAGLQVMRRLDVFVIEVDKKSHDGRRLVVICSPMLILCSKKGQEEMKRREENDKNGQRYQSLDRSTALGERKDKIEPLGG